MINFKRAFAAFIDYYISCFLSSLIIYIVTLGKLTVNAFTISLYFITLVITVLMRDFVFKNASIGKKILKLNITKTDGTNATFFDMIKRNLPLLILWPVEAFLLVFCEKRIGDMWAKIVVKNAGDVCEL